jgi:hypothetical protein
MIEFDFHACNYYETRGTESPPHASNNYKLQTPSDNMHWFSNDCCDSFIYEMPMRRKKVRF